MNLTESLADPKREWHDLESNAHKTGHCDPIYRRCKNCGDAHPCYINHCPLPKDEDDLQVDPVKPTCKLTGTDGNVPNHLRPWRNSYLIPKIGCVRVCTECGRLLKAIRFGKREGGKLQSHCRKCGAKKSREAYARNPEKYREAARRCRRENPERSRLNDLRHHLKSVYGMTIDDFNRMLKEQNRRCAICRTSKPNGPGKRFHVDHDHATKKVRGLLCSKCNIALGILGEDLGRIRRLYHYLKKHK